jgi:hypothetical protein
MICRIAPGRLSIKASLLGSPWERLTAAIQGSPRLGAGRVWIGSAVLRPAWSSRSRSAPPPTSPRREVDRELVPAGYELLGAVERIDQNEAAAIGWPRELHPFFRQRWNVRKKLRQSLADNAIGGEIGLGHRRAVELALNPHGVAVDGEDDGPGFR